jgi:hypothetical protein
VRAHTHTHTQKTGILLFYFMPCILISKCFGKWKKQQFYLNKNDDDDDNNNNNNNNNNISMMKTTYLLIKLKSSCLCHFIIFRIYSLTSKSLGTHSQYILGKLASVMGAQ